MLRNYKDLKVWQKAYTLCLQIYEMTKKYPSEANAKGWVVVDMKKDWKKVYPWSE
jgi:hypothetical protein